MYQSFATFISIKCTFQIFVCVGGCGKIAKNMVFSPKLTIFIPGLNRPKNYGHVKGGTNRLINSIELIPQNLKAWRVKLIHLCTTSRCRTRFSQTQLMHWLHPNHILHLRHYLVLQFIHHYSRQFNRPLRVPSPFARTHSR